MKKAIVSGANGFIGSAVVRYLIGQGVKVTALCHGGHDTRLPVSPLVKKINFDLTQVAETNREELEEKLDVFYHFAWAGSAGDERANTGLQLKNVQWTIDCLRLAREIGCKRFVMAGSIMEHETIAATYTDGNRPGLGYIYGSSKLVAHAMAMSVAANIGIDFVSGAITNAYGEGEFSSRMVNVTINKIIKGETPKFTAGTQNYDFVYIDDVARAFYLIGENGKAFTEYIIGSSTARPLKEFLIEMKNAIAPSLEFVFGEVPFTGVNIPISVFDGSKTEKDTGFRAEIGFGDGTRRTMKWLIKQEVRK